MSSYEELEPSASLNNAIFKLSENHDSVRRILESSEDDARTLLIESALSFCEMSRLCGDSDDLLLALAKTGYLERKFEATVHSREVYPAVLAERAEILWKRNESVEAVQTLRNLIENEEGDALLFNLVPREIVLAKLVFT